MSDPWANYYQATNDRPPIQLLIDALALTEKRRKALDLGAGALADTRHLLASKFQSVTAVDSSPAFLEYAARINDPRLEVRRCTFAEFPWAEQKFDFILAKSSLPFCERATFWSVLKSVTGSLNEGGILAIDFFGPNDSWNGREDIYCVSEAELRPCFAGLDVLRFEEEERDANSVAGIPKHWHILKFIVRKPAL